MNGYGLYASDKAYIKIKQTIILMSKATFWDVCNLYLGGFPANIDRHS